jgi:predicted transcriptional regulator
MVRTQIQLTDDLAIQIRQMAAREHVSMAEMIRRATARFLEMAAKTGNTDRYARALAATGRFRSGRRDLSVRHDGAFAAAIRTMATL